MKTGSETTELETTEMSIENSVWSVYENSDEFNQPTGEKYIANIITDGTFRNTATINSELAASVQVISYDKAIIRLVEYGDHLVQSSYLKEYDIKILDDNGDKFNFYGYLYRANMLIAEEEKVLECPSFINLLKNNNTLKIYIEDKDMPTTNYLFTIDMTGFNELYDELYDENFD